MGIWETMCAEREGALLGMLCALQWSVVSTRPLATARMIESSVKFESQPPWRDSKIGYGNRLHQVYVHGFCGSVHMRRSTISSSRLTP